MIFDSEPCKVLTFIDISHFKELVRLEKANTQIQLRESSVSHELVTPLRVIIAFAAHLKDTCRCSQDHIVDDIFATAKLLNLQMNDILDNMKITKKKLDPKIKVVDLSKVIDETIRIMKPQAHNKSIELISCLPSEPFRIGTDGERV